MGKSNNQPESNIYDEAVRVELASRAGGFKTRSLVKQAEEMLVSSSNAKTKWWY